MLEFVKAFGVVHKGLFTKEKHTARGICIALRSCWKANSPGGQSALERGGWPEGYPWAFLVSQDPQSGEVGPSAASLLQDLWKCHHVSSLLAVPKRGPSLSGKVADTGVLRLVEGLSLKNSPGDASGWSREACREASVWSCPGSGQVFISLCLHCGTLSLALSEQGRSKGTASHSGFIRHHPQSPGTSRQFFP